MCAQQNRRCPVPFTIPKAVIPEPDLPYYRYTGPAGLDVIVLMPPFCIGYEAISIGDYGSQAGPLDVPYDLAQSMGRSSECS
jgi:hypothetical protein